jgi:2'-5' RNA ligase
MRRNSTENAEANTVEYPKKINIHLTLQGSLRQLALAANKMVFIAGKSEIIFAPPSILQPHITLTMGWVDAESQFEGVKHILAECSEGLEPFFANAISLYAVAPKNTWIFMDVEPAKVIIAMKRKIHKAIHQEFRQVPWDVVNQPPHITVGYLPGGFNQEMRPLDSFDIPVSSSITAIGVSICGERGTCLGRLAEYTLGKKI